MDKRGSTQSAVGTVESRSFKAEVLLHIGTTICDPECAESIVELLVLDGTELIIFAVNVESSIGPTLDDRLPDAGVTTFASYVDAAEIASASDE
jgi:hypothetical protein